ncbi:MAG: peptidoglycan DD-metalloendopeptidase family protein [Alphaproteobacteria bacterium]|nr:peptidoglycan DD-metalloendopeptidase family protein [Alphaproteobacteria bacterium]
MTLFGGQILFAPTIRASQSDLAAVQAQIKKAEAQNKKIAGEVQKSTADVDRTRRDLVRAAAQVDKLESERAGIKNRIAELETKRERLAESIESNRERIAEAAAALLIISGAPVTRIDDTREYIHASVLLSGIADIFDSEVRAAAAQIKELERVQKQQRAEHEKLAGTVEKYGRQRNELDQLLRNRTAQNEKLRARQMDTQKNLRDLSARAKNISELTAGIAGEKVSVDYSFSSRRLRAPVSGRLVLKFGEKSELGLVSDGWRIRTRADALVTAPMDGRVEFSDNFRGYGRVLIISHKNSYYTVMTGLGAADVMLGQDVLAGEPVGRMPANAAEMYLEMRRGNKSVDPARIFDAPR